MILIIAVSGISATILIVLNKYGAFEYYRLHRVRKSWPAELCIFCIGFWLGVIQLGIVSFLSSPKIIYIAVALASASITKAIYENSKPKTW